MTHLFGPKWASEVPFNRLSQVWNQWNTGGFRMIHWIETTGTGSHQNTLETEIETIVRDTLKILKNIKGGTEKNLSYQNFAEIAEGVRLRLGELWFSTQKIDDAIAEAQRRISS